MGAEPKIQSLKEFEEAVTPILYPPPPAFQSKYGMLRWRDLDRPGPELEWLVDDFLTCGDKSIIGGPSQSGKSFVGIEVGMCIALNKPFFGKRVKPGLVVYQAGEGARGIKNRLRAYRAHHGIASDEDIPFVLLQNRIDLFSEEGDTKAVIEEIEHIRDLYSAPLQLFVIDTLAKAQGFADENSGKDMARVLDNADKIREATKAHVSLVHHLNADGTKLRGHTSVFANIDQVLSVTCDKETKIRTIKTAKMKDGADDLTVKFELLGVPLGKDKSGKEVSSCVCLPLGEKEEYKKAQGEKYFAATDNEKKVLRALFNALEDFGQAPPIGSKIPSSVKRVVSYDKVKEQYRRLDLREDDDPEKARSRMTNALKRSRERLEAQHVIGVDNPFLWFAGRPVMGVVETYPPKRVEKVNEIRAPGEDDDDIPF